VKCSSETPVDFQQTTRRYIPEATTPETYSYTCTRCTSEERLRRTTERRCVRLSPLSVTPLIFSKGILDERIRVQK
jgi:hypothetical protein